MNLSGLDAWIPAAHFADAARADRAVQTMCEIIDLAQDLGRVPVSMMMPSDDAQASLLIERAHRAGVEIADHALPQDEKPSREGIGFGIDPAAWLSQNKDPVAAVHAFGDRLIAARLVDLLTTGLRGPIGSGAEGRLDVTGYKIALSVNGYLRPIIIDARQWNDPWRGVEQTMQAWTD